MVPVPGPSALLAALVAAGLPTDKFLFLGFPPRKPGPRRRLFESVRGPPLHAGALRIAAAGGRRRWPIWPRCWAPSGAAAVARELTKPHEEIVRDGVGALAARYATQRPLGEVTLVVAGAADGAATRRSTTTRWSNARAPDRGGQVDAGRRATIWPAMTGRPRREVYKLITSARESARE